jgi:hypothetical protein
VAKGSDHPLNNISASSSRLQDFKTKDFKTKGFKTQQPFKTSRPKASRPNSFKTQQLQDPKAIKTSSRHLKTTQDISRPNFSCDLNSSNGGGVPSLAVHEDDGDW